MRWGPAKSIVAESATRRIRTAPAWFWTVVAGVHFELAEQPEVDMANFTGRPVVKEMLAVAICAFKDCTVDPCGVSGERPLRA